MAGDGPKGGFAHDDLQPMAQALQATLTLNPQGPGQVAAQREIVTALENALDARRQRILASRSEVNWVKWMVLMIQGFVPC